MRAVVSAVVAVLLVAVVEAGMEMPPNRSPLLSCSIDFPKRVTIAKQFVVNWADVEAGHLTKQQRAACFYGGRSAPRANFVNVSSLSGASKDWGVTMKVVGKYAQGQIAIEAVNHRREKVVLSLVNRGSKVATVPALPYKRDLPKRSTTTVATVKPLAKGKPWAFSWAWRVEPKMYYQAVRTQQLYSNGVFLIVQHTRKQSLFSLVNSREEEFDSPINVILRIHARPGTQYRNLVLSNGFQARKPITIQIRPGRTMRNLLTITTKDFHSPWGYEFSFRWTAGVSPRSVFGVAKPKFPSEI